MYGHWAGRMHQLELNQANMWKQGPLDSARIQRLFFSTPQLSLHLRGVRVVDPARGWDGVADLLVREGRLEAYGLHIPVPEGIPSLDGHGLVVGPALVDIHVHLRDPGFPEKETLESGACAAAHGGFGTICCMPNTEPPLDQAERIADIRARARSLPVRVMPIGTISQGRKGEVLADLESMAEAGAVGFSDDGDSTRSAAVMRQALAWSASSGLPIMVHCEEPTLSRGGVMHDGEAARALGLPGIPALAEELIVLRDLELARETGGWLHVLHVTTARAAAMVRTAKRAGVRVTAEVTPHHLLMTDWWVAGQRRFVGEDTVEIGPSPDPHAKVNPPLRRKEDARALLAAVLDGTIDCFATDHAPHHAAAKPSDLTRAAFGMIGLEFALPLLLRLIHRGVLSWLHFFDLFATRPATLFRLPGGVLRPGAPADVVVIDPMVTWQVKPEVLASRSANTPLLGMVLQGRAVLTVVDGKVAYADSAALARRACS